MTLCRVFDSLSVDPVSFDPMLFDPVSFDPGSFDPLSVNRGTLFTGKQTKKVTFLFILLGI